MYAHKHMVCISVTARHRTDRRRGAADHQGWMQNDWNRVLFESRLSLECDTRHVLVWRERNTQNNPIFVQERLHYRQGDVLV